MKYTSATQFDICQMTNRTDLYNNWTSIQNTHRMKKIIPVERQVTEDEYICATYDSSQ